MLSLLSRNAGLKRAPGFSVCLLNGCQTQGDPLLISTRDRLYAEFHPLDFPLSGPLMEETGGLKTHTHTSHLTHHIFTRVAIVHFLAFALEM